jgi:hypothetical protein
MAQQSHSQVQDENVHQLSEWSTLPEIVPDRHGDQLPEVLVAQDPQPTISEPLGKARAVPRGQYLAAKATQIGHRKVVVISIIIVVVLLAVAGTTVGVVVGGRSRESR